LPDSSCDLYFTDPPYYDSVPYADLADFFFVWLKRALPNHPLLKDPLDPGNPLTPKTEEITRDEISHLDGRPKKDAAFYEDGMKTAFGAGRRVVREDGIGCIIFAHKTTEGWEALLAGIIRGGWVVTASWPIATEMSSRMRARESAALATSVHLVCRPRTQNNIGDWGEVLRELPRRVKDWMERLQSEGIRGADLVFACIGPALEIYNMGGSIPPEIWNRLGTKLIPKLRSGGELTARVSFSVLLDRKAVAGFEAELRQILEDLGLEAKIQIEKL
jgi:adenine-specific DNA methylase